MQPEDDGYHDNIYVTAAIIVADPSFVRYDQRVEASLASINGVDITPIEETIRLGEKLIEYRAGITAEAIRVRAMSDSHSCYGQLPERMQACMVLYRAEIPNVHGGGLIEDSL